LGVGSSVRLGQRCLREKAKVHPLLPCRNLCHTVHLQACYRCPADRGAAYNLPTHGCNLEAILPPVFPWVEQTDYRMALKITTATTARARGAGGRVGVGADRATDPGLGRTTGTPVAIRGRAVCSGPRISGGATPASACPPDRDRDAGSPPVPGAGARAGRAARVADAGRGWPGVGGGDRGRARHGQITALVGMAPGIDGTQGDLPRRALLVLQ
jgi:hypothetical protein